MRRHLLLLAAKWLAAAAAIAAAAGCDGGSGGGSGGASTARRDADTRPSFVYARGADAVTLDPQKIDDGESVLIAANIFEGLVRYAARGTAIEPALATAWEVSEGGRTWTFTLREGVRFHDGSSFDADAVVFTFERLIDPDHPAHDAGRSTRPRS